MTMVDKSKKRKKRPITEEGIANVLGRYSMETVLKLLQEMAKNAGEKMDWNALVKETTTGISCAREYQMLWRHLAYGGALSDQHDNAANPLDDDSDLEDEVEAFPVVGRESTVEAAACVKVLIASDDAIDADVPNNLSIKAPLTINVPMFNVPSDSSLPADAITRKNITIPVSLPEDPPKKRGKSVPDSPRKRKVWSAEDDLKLTAAVRKHGEQNWDDIAGGDFKNDRTPEELSLRWANIMKKKSNQKARTSTEHSEARKTAKKKSDLKVGTSAELTEARKAATRAIFLALEPKGPNFMAARQMSYGTKATQPESRIASASLSNPQLGMAPPPKSQVKIERPPLHCTTSPKAPNPMIKAAAVAAGARIATQADASSVIEAASRSQNVFHIRTGASSLPKSSTTSMSNQPCSNFNHNGPSNAPVSAYSSTVPKFQLGVAKEAQCNSMKPREQAVQPKLVSAGNLLKPEVDERSSTSGYTLGANTQGDQTPISFSRSVNQMQDNQVVLPCSEVKDNGEKRGDIISKEIHDDASVNGKHDNLSCKSLNRNGEACLANTTATTRDEAND